MRNLKSVRLAGIALLALGGGAIADSTTDRLPDPASVGSPDNGRDLITRVGCGACHEIPGIPDATGMVGPPLDRMARRTYVAGMLHNTPDNMVRWIRFPQQVVPGNAMPDMGLSDAEARDIAAYLYTLR